MPSNDSLSPRLSLSFVLVFVCTVGATSQVLAQELRPIQKRNNATQQKKQVYGPQRGNLNPQPNRAGGQQRVPLRQAKAQPQAQAPAKREWPPKKFQLSPADQQRIDQMLEFWEKKTSDIKTLECQFGRWVYDPTFGPTNDAKTFTKGEIRYAAVDQGMIRETAVYDHDPAKKKKQDQLKAALAQAKSAREQKKLKEEIQKLWPFTLRENAIGEYWVCDGKSVYEFNLKAKELIEHKLPADMQGNAIADGPLPFMFGAKADKIKKRYWIREEPRKAQNAPYQLELLPKRMGEDYSKIVIQLDPKTFLPVTMTLYELNQVGRSSYSFIAMNSNGAMNNLQNFMGGFVRPKTPRGWKKLVRDVGAPQPGPNQQQPPRQAKGPTRPLK